MKKKTLKRGEATTPPLGKKYKDRDHRAAKAARDQRRASEEARKGLPTNVGDPNKGNSSKGKGK